MRNMFLHVVFNQKSSCANYFNRYTNKPTKVRMSNKVYSLYMADPWWT